MVWWGEGADQSSFITSYLVVSLILHSYYIILLHSYSKFESKLRKVRKQNFSCFSCLSYIFCARGDDELLHASFIDRYMYLFVLKTLLHLQKLCALTHRCEKDAFVKHQSAFMSRILFYFIREKNDKTKSKNSVCSCLNPAEEKLSYTTFIIV